MSFCTDMMIRFRCWFSPFAVLQCTMIAAWALRGFTYSPPPERGFIDGTLDRGVWANLRNGPPTRLSFYNSPNQRLCVVLHVSRVTIIGGWLDRVVYLPSKSTFCLFSRFIRALPSARVPLCRTWTVVRNSLPIKTSSRDRTPFCIHTVCPIT